MAKAYKCDNCGEVFEGTPLHYGEVEAHGFKFALLPSRRVEPGESEVSTPFGVFRRPKPEEEPLDLCKPCLHFLGTEAAQKLDAEEYTLYRPESDDDPLAGPVEIGHIMEPGD